ncbi:hypothetical protein GCM10029992_58010 [Glycomyces albus]
MRFSSMCARRIGSGTQMFQVQAHWRRKVTRRYIALPVSWHQKHPTGTLLSNANADVEAATRPLAPLPFACGTIFMILVSMAVFFVIDWAIALVAVAMFPTLLALNAAFATRMAPAPNAPRNCAPKPPRSPTNRSTAPWSSRPWAARATRPSASPRPPAGCATP